MSISAESSFESLLAACRERSPWPLIAVLPTTKLDAEDWVLASLAAVVRASTPAVNGWADVAARWDEPAWIAWWLAQAGTVPLEGRPWALWAAEALRTGDAQAWARLGERIRSLAGTARGDRLWSLLAAVPASPATGRVAG